MFVSMLDVFWWFSLALGWIRGLQDVGYDEGGLCITVYASTFVPVVRYIYGNITHKRVNFPQATEYLSSCGHAKICHEFLYHPESLQYSNLAKTEIRSIERTKYPGIPCNPGSDIRKHINPVRSHTPRSRKRATYTVIKLPGTDREYACDAICHPVTPWFIWGPEKLSRHTYHADRHHITKIACLNF
jgi:hypothetical protein